MSGADDDAKVGFGREEMNSEKLAGAMEPPVVHVFAVHGEAAAWKARVESMEGSPVKALQQAVKELNPDQDGDFEICATAAEAAGAGIEEGDLLVFPQRIRVPGGVSRTREVIEAIMKQRNEGGDLAIEGGDPIQEGFVFVCCHQARDGRCGYCGPKIVDATAKAIEKRGMKDKVRLVKCSHIGGHRYAGISVVFRNDAETTCDWLAYVTDGEEDVNHMLDLAVGVEETPALRLWRARNGMTPDEHKDFCAACAKKQGSADIEDAAGAGAAKKQKAKKPKKPKGPSKLESMSESELNAEIGFARSELEKREDLAGMNQPPDVHLFVAFKDALTWEGRLEVMEGSPVGEFDALVKELYPTGRKGEILTTAIEVDDTCKEGDVLILPQRIRVPQGASRAREIVEAIVGQIREGGDLSIEGAEAAEGARVFVCCHQARDARCGFCGPKIVDALAQAQKSRGVPAGKVTVQRCSHIGGHRYAGIGIVFRDDESATCDWLAYISDSKEDVNHLLDLATGAAETPELAMWRARMGKTKEEHKDLCAACAQGKGPSCSDDIEDLASGAASTEVSEGVEKATSTGKPNVLFVLGGPGAGKGTQCGLIVEDFADFAHLSAGDLLRAERQDPNSKNGQLISEYIKEGKIVPVEITVQLLWDAMQKSEASNFLIDGFPRNQNNLDGWDSVVGDKANVLACLYFDCPEHVMEDRLLERGKTSGRSDDNLESIKKRFHTYVESTQPIIQHFDKLDKCIHIMADRPVNTVFGDVRHALQNGLGLRPAKPRVLFVLGGPGAGKGTQCGLIVEDFADFAHLSAGDLLRAERQDPNSKNGQLISEYIKEGKIVPVEITVQLLWDAMQKSEASNFLIDGFPRNQNNLDGWESVVGDKANVLGCLYFDCPEHVMEDRLLERGKTSGRSDDNLESIKKRFHTYVESTQPIIQHFDKLDKCFHIMADRPVNTVFGDVRRALRDDLGLKAARPRVLFVLGGPGAGKGTQCGLIVEDFADFSHLSAGDLLRAERQDPNSKNGQLISEYIKEGKIVPVEITVQLLWDAMQKSEASNFLIDGFPRNQNNLDGWESVVGDKAKVLGCLYFDCPEQVMEGRLLERGKTSGRSDDNLESIKKRFHTYVESTQPIIQHFDKLDKCIRIVADRPVHLVFADVRRALRDGLGLDAAKPRVLFVLGGPGAGKGTQCELLSHNFDLCHLSAGDLLRAERNNPDSKDGALIKSYIKDGKIVPVEITVGLLLKAMLASGRGNFLIDGFPRNKNNLDGWASTIKDQADVLGCMYFDCPEDVMERRLLERGKTSGRSDDNLESIKKRFRTYQDETMPIIRHFQSQNKCFQIAADRSKETIQTEVNSIVENRLGLRPLSAWTASSAASSSGSGGDCGIFSRLSSRFSEVPPATKIALGATTAALLIFAGTRAARHSSSSN